MQLTSAAISRNVHSWVRSCSSSHASPSVSTFSRAPRSSVILRACAKMSRISAAMLSTASHVTVALPRCCSSRASGPDSLSKKIASSDWRSTRLLSSAADKSVRDRNNRCNRNHSSSALMYNIAVVTVKADNSKYCPGWSDGTMPASYHSKPPEKTTNAVAIATWSANTINSADKGSRISVGGGYPGGHSKQVQMTSGMKMIEVRRVMRGNSSCRQ